MKKIILSAAVSSVVFLVFPLVTRAENTPLKTGTSIPLPEQAHRLLHRLEEIKAMNKAGLGRQEKIDIRNEVRAIEYSLREISGGAYIPARTFILILALFILFA